MFPEDLPKGIPPKRTETDFQIKLKEYVKLIKKGPCRMSNTELAEIKKHVEYQMKTGVVRPSKSHGHLLYYSLARNMEV